MVEPIKRHTDGMVFNLQIFNQGGECKLSKIAAAVAAVTHENDSMIFIEQSERAANKIP